MPRLQRGVNGGFTTPPQETAFDVYNLQEHDLDRLRPAGATADVPAPPS